MRYDLGKSVAYREYVLPNQDIIRAFQKLMSGSKIQSFYCVGKENVTKTFGFNQRLRV